LAAAYSTRYPKAPLDAQRSESRDTESALAAGAPVRFSIGTPWTKASGDEVLGLA
jgi:hypothetical protein